MKTFILGYPFNTDLIPDNLIEYSSKEEAGYMAEEWCEVFAPSLEEAKLLYESTFSNWQTTLKCIPTRHRNPGR